MKPEQIFYQKLRPFLPGQVTRIENGVIPGMPDVVVVHNGIVAWIELKVSLPVGVLLRKEQYAWNMRCSMEGGRNFVFALMGPYIHIWRYPVISCEPYGDTHKYVKIMSSSIATADWETCDKIVKSLFTCNNYA